MNFFSQNKGIIISILVIVFVFIGYAIFKPASNEDDSTVVTREVVANPALTDISRADDPAAVLVYQLLTIKSIEFNTDFFNDPVYQSLIDRSRPLGEREVGRPNPFWKIGEIGPDISEENTVNGSAQTSSSTTPTQSTNNSRR